MSKELLSKLEWWRYFSIYCAGIFTEPFGWKTRTFYNISFAHLLFSIHSGQSLEICSWRSRFLPLVVS